MMKHKYLKLRRVLSYIDAVKNEIEIDEASYSVFGYSPKEFGFIPRPSKWVKKISGYPKSIKILLRAIRFFWCYFLHAIFFSKQLISFYAYRRKVTNVKGTPDFSKFALGFSLRATQLINSKNIVDAPDCWITFPWVEVNKSSLPLPTIDIFSLLTSKNLIDAYQLSLSTVNVFRRVNENLDWILQTYTAFAWFCARIAIEKLNGKFYTAEHFDRWAVLIDSVCAEKNGHPLKSELLLIQHGLVGELSPNKKLNFPYRLRAVNELYVYDDISESFFRKSILAESVNHQLKIKRYSHSLILDDVKNGENFQLLFVGHPFCEDLHIFLFEELNKKYGFHAFYKPHPLNPHSLQVKNQKWQIIDDTTRFPNVDLIVSYPSTLVMEYKALGIDAVVHPLEIKTENADEIFNQIETALNGGTYE